MSTPDFITMETILEIVKLKHIKPKEYELYGIPEFVVDNKYYLGALAKDGKYIIYYKAPIYTRSKQGIMCNLWVSTFFLENLHLFGIPIVEVEL